MMDAAASQPDWWAERDRRRERAARRKPKKEFIRVERGWCTFCGDEVIEPNGERAKRKTWHPGCLTVWQMAQNHGGMAGLYVFGRDRGACGKCGQALAHYEPGAVLDPRCVEEGIHFPTWRFPHAEGPFTVVIERQAAWELDHRIPLWSFDGEAPLWAFLPGNLWCLCVACHKAKTSAEARERAAIRRQRRQPALQMGAAA